MAAAASKAAEAEALARETTVRGMVPGVLLYWESQNFHTRFVDAFLPPQENLGCGQSPDHLLTPNRWFMGIAPTTGANDHKSRGKAPAATACLLTPAQEGGIAPTKGTNDSMHSHSSSGSTATAAHQLGLWGSRCIAIAHAILTTVGEGACGRRSNTTAEPARSLSTIRSHGLETGAKSWPSSSGSTERSTTSM